jgi:hypothetical protein
MPATSNIDGCNYSERLLLVAAAMSAWEDSSTVVRIENRVSRKLCVRMQSEVFSDNLIVRSSWAAIFSTSSLLWCGFTCLWLSFLAGILNAFALICRRVSYLLCHRVFDWLQLVPFLTCRPKSRYPLHGRCVQTSYQSGTAASRE